jgi:phosphatidylserine/phosphatidylglycerophosphate/cardiolipin synthase-like enzyme
MPSSADDILASLLAGAPLATVDALASALERGDITLGSSSVGIDAVPGVGPDAARRAAIAFRAVRPEFGELATALALRVANRLRAAERLSRPEIEIVWTGPPAPDTIMRPTGAVVEEMLREARDSGEILIVGYSLTAADGTLMRGVIDLLANATGRGVGVTLVLHRDDEQRNRANLLQAWNVFARKPKVLTWRPGPEHPYTKLHAKALVVDRLDLLVTSANLTFHGLESNLELGLRIRGPQAAVVAERFDQLEADRVLEIWRD